MSRVILGVFTASCFVVAAASAQTVTPHQSGGKHVDIGGWSIDTHLSIGLLNGESVESVYYPVGNPFAAGQKISQLNWTLDNVPMIGTGLSLSPISWLRLNATGWWRVAKDSATMDDFDWIGPSGGAGFDRPAQHDFHSHHEKTLLDQGRMIDVNTEITAYNSGHLKVRGIAGYKNDYWKWSAYDGTFTYSLNPNNPFDPYCFRCYTGNFTGLGISYRQEFSTPYLGVGFQGNIDRLQLSGRIIGSNWVDVKATDRHFQNAGVNGTRDTADFEKGRMIAVDLEGSYQLTENLSLSALYHFQRYDEVQGFLSRTIVDTGQVINSTQPWGADHESHMVSLALKYRFGPREAAPLK